ncbi:Dot/Icm system substrate protein LidA [Legionella busanensis]|uniref:Dot/Icm system substrate protein LidA n=1 Tax=Legionella busanensis TaxID=190655 RepID=A0A378JLC9_9GAMM|nr:hypothetical protein [Legionella busanensis]STX51877.1 Dot/Icm system substrate protein LidA [Legionella busanensis]
MSTKLKQLTKLLADSLHAFTDKAGLSTDIALEELSGPNDTILYNFLVKTLQERADRESSSNENTLSGEASKLLEELGDLAQRGLKDAKDVMKFLESKAGETLREQIIAECIKEIDEEENMRHEIREQQERRHHILAYLLHKLAHRKSEYWKRICEYAQEQIEKLLKHEQDIHKFLNTEDPIELKETLELTEEIIEKAQKDLAGKEAEIALINKELFKIDEYKETIDKRYAAFETGLDEVNQFELQDPTDPGNTEAIKDNIANRITKIENQLKEQTLAIDKLLASENPADEKRAMDLMHEHNKLHMQLAMLKDMHDVYEGKKTLYDEHGNETRSFAEAVYILKPDQKFIKENNTFLLIDKNTDYKDEKWKEKAAAAFVKRKPELVVIPGLVKENKEAENKFHQERAINASSKRGRQSTLNQEINQLKNQITHLQATKASIEAELRRSNHDLKKAQRMQSSRPSDSHVPLQSILGRAVTNDIETTRKQDYQRQQIYTPTPTAPKM